ncbi:preprotein translocase subunit SecE [Thiomicrospira pelophila]|uniref:preprotein translocase subunit SecE n=1 Tax=Thiomicrospira pelophila TaxID=934 RepID=UPI0004A76956|nr:preprotein translocase subunit SecE [Thiomicrospira pelophila]
MNKKSEVQESRNVMDTIKMFLSIAILLSSIVAYYTFAEWHAVVRILVVLFGVTLAGYVLYKTELGASWFKYLVHTKKEVRQVVWPTRKETVQTTLIVVIAVILVGIFLWLIDMFFLWAVKLLTGQGG